MAAFFDPIDFLGRIRIRSIVGRKHPTLGIPAKPIRISQTTREHLDLRLFRLRIEPPNASSERNFAPLEIARILPRLIPIGSRAAADINPTIRADGHMPDPVVEWADPPWERSPKPRFGLCRLTVLVGRCAEDRHVVGHDLTRLVAMVGPDIK